MLTATIRNWERWQTYRRDRGQPPWIKVHRLLLRNPEWVNLSDAQRGQLIVLWLLAADRNGTIPADPGILMRLGLMTTEPDLKLFETLGFLELPDSWRQDDVSVASTWRQDDANVTPQRQKQRQRQNVSANADTPPERSVDHSGEVLIELPTNNGKPYPFTSEHLADLKPLYPAVDVLGEVRKAKGWLVGNPTKRKTHRGMMRFLTYWLSKQQDRAPMMAQFEETSSLERLQQMEAEMKARKCNDAKG